MRISHPCPGCGADLRRQRACRADGLPIVTCPGCGRATTRRTHRIAARRRTAVRLGKSLGALVLQIGALVLFVAVVLRLCDPYAHDLLAGRTAAAPLHLATGVIAIALGAWLTAAFAHWSRLGAWLAFAGVAIAGLAVTSVFIPLIAIAVRKLGVPVAGPPIRLDILLAGTASLGAIMVIATVGIPVGTALRAGVERGEARVWRARRRRRRERSLR